MLQKHRFIIILNFFAFFVVLVEEKEEIYIYIYFFTFLSKEGKNNQVQPQRFVPYSKEEKKNLKIIFSFIKRAIFTKSI